ncbi:hypothetical protein [Streptomyces sp. NPDC005969]|uniref:hypothetical protein n=1 Tax=Streptomyces sp. NPDC005969 TaxID=3156722 RepID=UPI0034084AFE
MTIEPAAETRFAAWIADPANKVPVHQLTGNPAVNWQLLTYMIGVESRRMHFFATKNRAALDRRAATELLVSDGRVRTSLIDGFHEVTWPMERIAVG